MSNQRSPKQLELTDEGIEMPEMLKGYTGEFTIKTGALTGDYETTDAGMPETEYYDGPIATYPEGGSYNPEVGPGEMLIEIEESAGHGIERELFEIVDKRTENNDAN